MIPAGRMAASPDVQSAKIEREALPAIQPIVQPGSGSSPAALISFFNGLSDIQDIYT